MQGRTEGLPPPGQSADWTIDQNWHGHTTVEHATWKALFERQGRLLPGRACDEFVRGMRDLPIGPGQIPDFRRLSEVLMRRTGWQVVAVPGLVPDEVFFAPASLRRSPKACSHSTARRRTGSPSTSSASCEPATASTTFRKAIS